MYICNPTLTIIYNIITMSKTKEYYFDLINLQSEEDFWELDKQYEELYIKSENRKQDRKKKIENVFDLKESSLLKVAFIK